MSVMEKVELKAPFPAFGGKSRIASMVWARLGAVRNYVEPFCFSAAMLLKRPGGAGAIETVNDANAFVANFWRAVRADPDAVAHHADWPVVEDDLHARHRWLVRSHEAGEKLTKVREDPDFFDAKIAGWWCWGSCMWIGSGWCDESHRNSGGEQRCDQGQGVTKLEGPSEQVVPLSMGAGQGVIVGPEVCGKRPRAHSGPSSYMPGVLNGTGMVEGRGTALQNRRHVHAMESDAHRPQLADAYSRGRGVNGNDSAGTCERRREWITGWMRGLADRLRPVRVCCGHWARVCDSDSTLTRLGTTGVFLDPPYRITLGDGTANRAAHIYANDRSQDVNALCDEVQAWCLKWGADTRIRIALCGLEGEYPELDALCGAGAGGWERVAWKSRGGYGNRSESGKANAARERVWFSPGCVQAAGLWGGSEGGGA